MKLKHIIFIDNLKRKCKTEFLDTVSNPQSMHFLLREIDEKD